nr:hypothetical protein [Mycobacterium florentinum]
MGELECVGDIGDDANRTVGAQRARADSFIAVHTGDVAHRDPHHAIRGVAVENSDDVLVLVELGQQVGLAAELLLYLLARLLVGSSEIQGLERDQLVQVWMPGQINGAETTDAQWFQDLIAREHATRCQSMDALHRCGLLSPDGS